MKAPGWASLADAEFAALDKYPAICGEFVWTGFDYLGEPTPFNSDMSVLLNHAALSEEELAKAKEELKRIEKERPSSRSSYFGIVDLAGFPIVITCIKHIGCPTSLWHIFSPIGIFRIG